MNVATRPKYRYRFIRTLPHEESPLLILNDLPRSNSRFTQSALNLPGPFTIDTGSLLKQPHVAFTHLLASLRRLWHPAEPLLRRAGLGIDRANGKSPPQRDSAGPGDQDATFARPGQ